jgi:hypothetical protein
MAATPVDFSADAGQPGYSAKVNRLIRQDIRMGRPLGTQAAWISVPTGAAVRVIHICRFPYRPQRNPYNRLFVFMEYGWDDGGGTGSVNINFEYTVDDGTTWIPLALTPATPWFGMFAGTFELDLSAIVFATWMGVRLTYHNAVAADPWDLIFNGGQAFLYRADLPPF